MSTSASPESSYVPRGQTLPVQESHTAPSNLQDSRQAERAAIKRALSYAVGETLFPVAIGLGLLYLVFGIAHRFTLPPAIQPTMMAVAFSSTSALLLLALFVYRWPVHNSYTHLLSTIMAGFVLLNSIIHMWLTNDPLQSSNFMLLLVGVGFFLLSSRWFAGVLLVIFLCWGNTMMQIGGEQATITHFSFGLLSAAVLATLLHYARKRMLTRLTLLRRQDELRAGHLQIALEAEREGEMALRHSEANYRRLNQELEARAKDLQVVNQQLAKASQLKDEFLASMSHELRTPLTAILGLTESMQEQIYGPLNNRQLTALHNVTESGRHLLTLINDVLDVAKTEAGKLTLQLTPADVAMICDVSLRLVRQEAMQKGISLTSQVDERLSLILADERRLKQMLVNLLSNAIKFSAEGEQVGLEVSSDRAEERVRFTVWDRGIGIADDDLDRLFKPFVQLDSKLSRRYEGTGLGLVLVYRMAAMHGGSVSVESQFQQGSRFTITLPWRKVIRDDEGKLTNLIPPVATPTLTAQYSAPQVMAPQAIPSMQRAAAAPTRTVLVIDEHELSSGWIAAQIAPLGGVVQQVKSHSEALSWLKMATPVLILLDVQLAHQDALAFVLTLQETLSTAQIPIVAMSALTLPGAAQRYLDAGATHYCAKPVARTLLATLLWPTTGNE